VRVGEEKEEKHCTYNRKKTRVLEKSGEKPRTRGKSQEERIYCSFDSS